MVGILLLAVHHDELDTVDPDGALCGERLAGDGLGDLLGLENLALPLERPRLARHGAAPEAVDASGDPELATPEAQPLTAPLLVGVTAIVKHGYGFGFPTHRAASTACASDDKLRNHRSQSTQVFAPRAMKSESPHRSHVVLPATNTSFGESVTDMATSTRVRAPVNFIPADRVVTSARSRIAASADVFGVVRVAASRASIRRFLGPHGFTFGSRIPAALRISPSQYAARSGLSGVKSGR